MHLTPSDASKLCTSISFLKLTSLHLLVDDCYPVIARYVASLISKSSLLEDLKIFCRGKSILERCWMDLGLRRIETKAWLVYLLNRSTILLKDQLCLEGTSSSSSSSTQAIYRYFRIDCRRF